MPFALTGQLPFAVCQNCVLHAVEWAPPPGNPMNE